MSKRTERMSRSAAERINRKDTVIRQNNAELEELRSQYENLDICEEDKQVIDDYIACKDARADRMAEKLYEKGRKDVKRCVRIRKLIRRCMILSVIATRINVGRKCPIFLVGRWSIINPTNGSLMASRKRAIRNSVAHAAGLKPHILV